MTDNLISVELLKKLTDNGNIDVNTIITQLKQMDERQTYLSMHTCKPWLASDGFWKTKIKEGNKYRLIKKKELSDLEDVLVEHYKRLSQKNNSFKDWFNIWIQRQKDCGRSDNTILKYQSDYRRFYEGYPIEDKNIKEIDEVVLSKHIMQVLNEKQIPWRAFKEIMGYTSGVYDKAVRDKVIDENPFKYIDLPIYKKYCYIPPVKTTKQRTLSDNDIHTLIDKLHNPRAHNVNKMCCFAIELALYTGMRVGELSALMWEDIIFEEDIFLIRRAERFNRATKESEIILVKNGKERIYPLIDEIEMLFFRIRSYEADKGYLGDYVFMDSDGRLTKSKISDTTRNLTMSGEFTGTKSIHAIRRTINSKMRCNGVSSTIASSLLGHTERVNEQNYTYDVSEMQEKKQVVQSIVTKSNQT